MEASQGANIEYRWMAKKNYFIKLTCKRYVLSNFLFRIGCEEDFTGVKECSTDLVTVCQVRTITSQRSQIFFPTEGSALHVPECAVCRSVQGFEARGSSCSSRISLLKVPTSSLIFKISRVVIPIVIPYLALYWKYYFLVILEKESLVLFCQGKSCCFRPDNQELQEAFDTVYEVQLLLFFLLSEGKYLFCWQIFSGKPSLLELPQTLARFWIQVTLQNINGLCNVLVK